MKRALISGITGQDGSYLAEFLLAKPDYEVHGLVRRSSSLNRQRIDHLFKYDSEVRDRLHLHYADLADASSLSTVMEQVKPDEVYNLGAQSHVRVSFDQPLYTADVVGLGTLRLLEAVRQINQAQAGRSSTRRRVRRCTARRLPPRGRALRFIPAARMPVPSSMPTGRPSITVKPTACSRVRESSSITKAPAGVSHS